MLAGKFAARTRALVTSVGLRNDDPIGRCTGPLRLAPDQPGLIAGQCRPGRRLQQLASRVERSLIRRQGFDLRKAQHHLEADLLQEQNCGWTTALLSRSLTVRTHSPKRL